MNNATFKVFIRLSLVNKLKPLLEFEFNRSEFC